MLSLDSLRRGQQLLRVKSRGGGADPLRARRALERELALAQWQPPALPARAVLFVRRLALTATTDRRLAAQLSDSLSRQASQACRPWLQADASQGNAVVFADETEMVACLVRDWLQGVLPERWWWRGVLAGASPAVWLRQHVLTRGEALLPVAMQLMESARESARATVLVEAWFERLDEVQATEAAVSVAHAFALAIPITLPTPRRLPNAAERPASALADNAQPDAPTDAENAAFQHLLSVAPELFDSHLPPAPRRLLGQVLALTRSPRWARTPQLASALWCLDQPASVRVIGPFARHVATPESVVQAVADHAERVVHREGPTTQEPPPSRRRNKSGKPLASVHTETLRTASSMTVNGGNLPGAADSSAPAITTDIDATAPVIREERDARSEEPVGHRSIANSVRLHPTTHTDFGGLFYLLNAALSLGLYGDFTAPRTPGLALSPWDWLALVGKAWFGDAVVRDPVWALLASLAGRRASDTPGQDFAAPTDWHLNPEWFKPWGRVQTLHLHASKSRLQVLHPAGFVVFDVARNPSLTPHQQALALCRKLKPLRGAALIGGPGLALPRPGTARWLRCLLSHLQARLALALGSATPHHMPELVCRHSAQVTVSTSEVDVAMSLSDLPLPLRIAGLDRDTGWIPAAGRSVRFHFS